MERSEAKVKFQDADRLFQSQQYSAALEVLQELNREFPDERHVLYPMARSLTGLKRYDEAREIAVRLATEFHYLPAQELIDRIDRLQTANDGYVETPALPSALDDITATPASFGAPRTPQVTAPNSAGADSWQPHAIWIGAAVVSFVAMVVVGLKFAPPFDSWMEEVQAFLQDSNPDFANFPPIPWVSILALTTFNSAFGFVLACFASYWSIKVVDSLRFSSFGENMKDVAIITLIGLSLIIIIFVGWIIFLVILAKRYELSIGKLFAAVLLFLVFDFLLSLPTGVVYSLIVRGRPI